MLYCAAPLTCQFERACGGELMEEVRIRDWSHLQKELFADSLNTDLGRYRAHYAFRGLDDAGKYDLKTSLMRLGGNYYDLERHMIRNFRKYAHRDVVEKDSLWHWLSVAQHHGLPTRILDWSYSPLVAAHFATSDPTKMDTDGVIWMLDFFKAYEYLPDDLKESRELIGGYGFDLEVLPKLFPTLEELDALAPPDFLIFFEPPSIDDRIVNQYALFSVMSSPKANLDEWLKERPDVTCRKVIIPAGEIKWEIRDKLDHANVTERVLFGGLDGLSKWLKRHYSPGPESKTQSASSGSGSKQARRKSRR